MVISRTVEATYLAALPNPGVWSVWIRSLSIDFWFSEDTDITACLRSITGKFAHRIHGIISTDIGKTNQYSFLQIF